MSSALSWHPRSFGFAKGDREKDTTINAILN